MYTLISRQPGEARRYVLPPGDSIAGRAPSCEIVVDDSSVSRQHAKFTVTERGCTVVDLTSRNGTYLNGRLVTRGGLRDGDRISLGRVPLEVEYSSVDSFALSEDRTIELPGTVYRPVAELSALLSHVPPRTEERSLRLLVEVGRTLVGDRPPGEVFQQIATLAFDTCPAERVFLVLKDHTAGTLVPRVACRRDGTDIRSVSLSRTILQRVMTDRVAIMASDLLIDSGLAESKSLRVQRVQSFMCAPLWDEREVIGVLYVDASQAGRFSAQDLDLLTALANFAAVAIERARLGAQVTEEIQRRERLERYHSPAVVSRILAGDGETGAFFAQERDVSVLFADLVGFTGLSEGLTPAQTAAVLNGFFECMADVVFENEGTLDKFIGDALMTVFGAPLEQPDHAVRAVRTAQLMQLALERLNEESTDVPLRMRIGIHSGLVRAGDIGSLRRREYTVLGDVVNIASRLESEIAQPGQIVVSGVTRAQLEDTFRVRPLGRVSLRGRKEPVDAYDVAPLERHTPREDTAPPEAAPDVVE